MDGVKLAWIENKFVFFQPKNQSIVAVLKVIILARWGFEHIINNLEDVWKWTTVDCHSSYSQEDCNSVI